jgi:hypothetical protein
MPSINYPISIQDVLHSQLEIGSKSLGMHTMDQTIGLSCVPKPIREKIVSWFLCITSIAVRPHSK